VLVSPMEKGQGLVEYSLIFVLVILIVIVILYLLGPSIGNMYSSIISDLVTLK
jgi:pilus assembly protein Flp/PilA